MSKLRFRVVETASEKEPAAAIAPTERPSEYFARYIFNKEEVFGYLPSKIYVKSADIIDDGALPDHSAADEMVAGMKKWALEVGITHCTH